MPPHHATRLQAALHSATQHLLSLRNAEGYWEGLLSSSALSTATAISAIAQAADPADAPLLRGGLAWLAQNQNADGGWGDTPDSPSNLSTTILVACAMEITACGSRKPEGGMEELPAARTRAEAYIIARAGRTVPELVAAIRAIYGADRTFAVPILMNCALAGLVPWAEVPPLPFELALFPRALYKVLRLHVVSYALPALIAVGTLVHRRHPSPNPLLRALRDRAAAPAIGLLAGLQPESGGFLEATPLTSFVTMSLIPQAGPAHPVAVLGLGFLRRSARPDGSWPIDTNLAVWVTTGALQALAHAGALGELDARPARRWLAARQWHREHPFTGAAPGGFAWTHLSGGVPDADDTAGAILALHQLGEQGDALPAAVTWLLDLQNGNGGWPTFCRGWGKLPFDQSSPDLTAHVLRALAAAAPEHHPPRVRRAIAHGFRYLQQTQRADGSWVPLWFGNQRAPNHENPVVGTARVLLAWAQTEMPDAENPQSRGVRYLLGARNPDGGWGGAPGVPSTVEETALALSALARFTSRPGVPQALPSGRDYLIGRVEDGSWRNPAPLGLYFASLWYSEIMYPVIWTVEALGALAALD